MTALEPVQRPSVFSLEIVERARENRNRKRMGVWVGRGENCFFPRVSCSFSCASESGAESSKKKNTSVDRLILDSIDRVWIERCNSRANSSDRADRENKNKGLIRTLSKENVDVPDVKNGNRRLIFSLFQCSHSTNTYSRG